MMFLRATVAPRFLTVHTGLGLQQRRLTVPHGIAFGSKMVYSLALYIGGLA